MTKGLIADAASGFVSHPVVCGSFTGPTGDGGPALGTPVSGGVLRLHGVELDRDWHELSCRGRRERLEPGVALLFRILAAGSPYLVSEATILLAMYPDRPEVSHALRTGVLRNRVCVLRKALAAVRAPLELANRQGRGYGLRETASAECGAAGFAPEAAVGGVSSLNCRRPETGAGAFGGTER